MKEPLYLDYNATAPLRPEALQAYTDVAGQTGNASSVHGFGRASRKVVEDARRRVAAAIDVDPSQVIFLSGGTEANATALGSVIDGRRPELLLVSEIEHPSVLQAFPDITGTLPVDPQGRLTADVVGRALDAVSGEARVSVMLANNETGVIQPVREIAKEVHARNGLLHCDAVQALGKIPLSFPELGADILSLSAHKLGGPQGVGALVLGKSIHMEAYLRGGGQEGRRRAGTENVAGIAAFGAAVEAAVSQAEHFEVLRKAHRRMEQAIMETASQAVIFGGETERLPNTSCIAMPGVSSELQLMSFDLEGIAVSAGSACSSGKVEPSHVLKAMGAGESLSVNAIRVSSGWASKPDDLERLAKAWTRIYQRQHQSSVA